MAWSVSRALTASMGVACLLNGCDESASSTPAPTPPTPMPPPGQCQQDSQGCITNRSAPEGWQSNCCSNLNCLYNKETQSSFCYDLTNCVGAGKICDYYHCCSGLKCLSLGPVLQCQQARDTATGQEGRQLV
eukprot:TRINITY_DN69526_c0_g1_i2.p1 TRINITY_DN69526_c0_g1~~TRINITY_DN69526_c0_g1_i2.p1  ORF type:complete len:132 (-),score=7.28 TRINITY_DN69526_c0_g1_i2:8-403(-)